MENPNDTEPSALSRSCSCDDFYKAPQFKEYPWWGRVCSYCQVQNGDKCFEYHCNHPICGMHTDKNLLLYRYTEFLKTLDNDPLCEADDACDITDIIKDTMEPW